MANLVSNASPVPFLDLTSHVDAAELTKLDEAVLECLKNREAADRDVETTPFTAENRKHADAIQFCDRDTSTWCSTDMFVAMSGKDDFRQCRAHRGDNKTWRPNKNAFEVPGILEFVRTALPFCEARGKVALIFKKEGEEGVEVRWGAIVTTQATNPIYNPLPLLGSPQHADHKLDDLVSEFVWIRTASSNKQFYVKDSKTRENHFIPRERARVGWFDDHLVHNIEKVKGNENGGCWSIRVDGRFNTEFRKVVVEEGIFGDQKIPQEGDEGRGLRGVLASQQNGPTFLQRENERVSDEEEEEEGGGGGGRM